MASTRSGADPDFRDPTDGLPRSHPVVMIRLHGSSVLRRITGYSFEGAVVNSLLLAALLAAPPTADATTTATTADADLDEATEAVLRCARTGTLLFSRGDCLAVKFYTASPYTHVGIVVSEDGESYVYDSMNGPGVRRQTLAEYVRGSRPDRMQVMNPHRVFSPRRRVMLRERLDEELGRPYGVAHHVTGDRAAGLHCSEYVTDALVHCRLLTARNPAKVSPASLHEGIVETDLYAHVLTVELGEPPEDREVGTSWGHQLWIDTKICTRDFGRKMTRTLLCR